MASVFVLLAGAQSNNGIPKERERERERGVGDCYHPLDDSTRARPSLNDKILPLATRRVAALDFDDAPFFLAPPISIAGPAATRGRLIPPKKCFVESIEKRLELLCETGSMRVRDQWK